MDLKWVIVMVVGAIIGYIGRKKQEASWGQGMLIIGAIIAIGGAVMNFMGFIKSGNKAVAVENRYRYIQGKILAENIKKSCSPSKACVIVNPLTFLDKWGDPLPKAMETGFLEGVQDGLGSSCQVVPVYPEFKNPRPKDPGKAMDFIPYASMSSKDYQKVVSKIKKEKPDCVINTYMFPPDAPFSKALADLKGMKVGLLNTDFYKKSDAELKAAFKDGGKTGGELLFVVQQKNDIDSDVDPSSDQKAFKYRYVMLTKDNVEQGLQEANKK